MLKVLLVASECVPFSKTGGLADVVGALPKELVRQGVDARVITPLYSSIPEHLRSRMEHVLFFYVNMGWRRQYVGIEKLNLEGVTYYFIDNEYYFGRSYIYGLGGDEGERFAYFCRAVLEALPQIDFVPDVLHLNDWQTGLVAPMLEIQYRVLPLYKKIRTVYTIHNLQYQGLFPIAEIEDLVALGNDAYTSQHMEFFGQCSFTKGGLTYADKITTVSPTYAQEIQTAYYGERLDGLLRARAGDLVGILNGIDLVEYDPATDPAIARQYTAEAIELKVQNKLALQKELHLDESADTPLIAMITRLSGQKGLDLVDRVLDGIMATGAQLVVLGMGEDKYMDLFSWAQWKYAGKIAARFEMNGPLAHRIYAGADMFLMPSMFEPCGLSQMIALRYGTLPITRETGGLRDTVLSYNRFTGQGNGFTFFNYNAHDMLHVIQRAVRYYNEEKDIWTKLMRQAMRGKYGWDQSAGKYIALYQSLGGGEAPAAEEPAAEELAAKEAPVAEEPKRKPSARKAAAKPKEAKPAEEKPAEEKPAEEKKPVKRRSPAKKAAAEKPAEENAPAAEKPAPKRRAPRKKTTETP